MTRRWFYALIRFFSPHRAQRRELRDKEIATRSAAYRGAFEIAEVVGPMQMAEDLRLVGMPLEKLAVKVSEDYHPEARTAAKRGTIDGFQAYMRRGEQQAEAL